MAGDDQYSVDIFGSDEDDPRKQLASILSPQPAQSLVAPPPNTAPRTPTSTTTPQTGSLSYAPTQAQPKVAAPAMLPGVAARPETLAQNGTQPASPIGAVQPARPSGVQPAVARAIQPATATAQPQTAFATSDPQLNRDQARLAALTQAKVGGAQIQNPVGRAAVRTLDTLGSILAPGAAQYIPGSTLNQQRQIGQVQGRIGAETQAADVASQTQERAAQGQKAAAQAASDVPMNPTAEQAAGVGHPEIAGLPIPQRTYATMLKAKQDADSREQVGAGHDDVRALASGMKAVTGPDGKQTYVEDPDSPVTQQKQAQVQLAQAKAELAKAGNDPRSPAYQLALKKANTAQVNANAATTRATAYMGQYLQRAYNKGLGGDVLPGAPQIGNDQGDRTVVGTGNANTATKAQANVAQFNDVHGALDSLESSAKALVQSGGKLNSPRVAAMLAQPPGTLGKWLQGEGAKSGATKEERDYAIANAAAHENIQAMRKAAGGTATDSSVAKLDALIPGASTPDLDYFLRQTRQIRQTAQRLGTGVTTAAGGSNLRNTPQPATPGGGLKGPVRPGEKTAIGPNNHTIVVRGGKWVDPQTGLEAK